MNFKKERHLFPGGNTHKGFHSFYSYILTQENANRIICLKGGPGTGKSFLMKKVANHFKEKGYSIEYHHCSSDADSLDAIVIKELNVAMLDGTSPHVVDPITPGAVDEIINLGVALNSEVLSLIKNEIMEVQKNISNNFKRAYMFLAAAKEVHNDWTNLNASALNACNISIITESIKNEIFTNKSFVYGKERHLFATAFTPSGIITHAKELSIDFERKYIIKGGPGFNKSHILKDIGMTAKNNGYFVEYMHDPFIPDRIEHIFIPEISTCILTENEINRISFEGKKYNIEYFCDPIKISSIKEDVEYDKELFYSLTDKALAFILKAHELHDDLEAFYINAMDYNVVDNIYNDIIEKFEKYEVKNI